jgi:glycosyltransferase involved in cell wall biosynthesis
MTIASPTHVLIVSHYYWPENLRINQVVDDLRATGARVTVLTGHPNYPDGHTYPGYRSWAAGWQKHPHGYDILRVPVVPRGRSGAVRLFLNYVTFVLSGATIGAWMLRKRRFNVQFVYCTTPVIQGLIALFLKRLYCAPVVLWVQDIWPRALSATGYISNPTVLGFIGKIVRFIYRGSDLILGQSHSFVRLIAPQAGGTPVDYFPNPGEHPQIVEPAGRLDQTKFNVVFAGNVGRAQAMETVVDAAALLAGRRDIMLTIVGSGSMYDWVQAQVKSRDLSNVQLLGRLPPDQMPGIYGDCDALLLPLVDDPDVAETVPSKLQSYFGAGKPIIAAVNGEAARIVEEAGAGIACSAEDPQALAGAIRTLCDLPPESRANMSRLAIEYFRREYHPVRLAQVLAEHLRRLPLRQG